MAWPPSPPPNDRTDDTVMQANHPTDHNQLSDNITETVNELGNDPSGTWANVTDRLADHAALQASGGGSPGSQTFEGPLVFNGLGSFGASPTSATFANAVTTGAITANGDVTLNTGKLDGPNDFEITNGTGETILLNQTGNIIRFKQGNVFRIDMEGSFFRLRDASEVEQLRATFSSDNPTIEALNGNLNLNASGSVLVNSQQVQTEGAWSALTVKGGWANVTGRQVARWRQVGTDVDVEFNLTGGTFTDGTTILSPPVGIVTDMEFAIFSADATGAARVLCDRTAANNTDIQVWGIGGATRIGGRVSFSTVA